MKTLATYLKISFFFLVFIQVRVLKSVMFWKHNWDFNFWLNYRDEGGKNVIAKHDISVLLGLYAHSIILWIGWLLDVFWIFALSITIGHAVNYFFFVRK